MPTDSERVQLLVDTVRQIANREEREHYLDRACQGNRELRQRVEAQISLGDEVKPEFDASTRAMPLVENGPTQSFRVPGGAAIPPEPDDGTGEPDWLAATLAVLAPASRPDSLGRIGHYEVLEVLGLGGFGVVFRAFDDVLHRIVAVKLLSPQLATTSPARKRFLREARASASIRHENVVQVYEVGEQPLPYIVMEFIPGETLQQRLNRTGPLEVPEVLEIGRKLAEGLAAAHAAVVIHRDIKPSNILIESGTLRVKLTDFGLARAADDASISQSGVIAGTPMYMAPEQAKGEPLDQRADLFSLGSVLYVMVTGRPPFRANSTLAVLKRVVEDQPRPIPELIPETPSWLIDIIARLHAKSPADRFPTAQAVGEILVECERQYRESGRVDPASISMIPLTPPAAKRVDAKRLRKRWLAAGSLIGSLFILLILGLGLGGQFPALARLAALGRNEPATPTNPVAPTAEAQAQVDALRQDLQMRNPEFNGKITPRFEHGELVGVEFLTDAITDLTPLRSIPSLRKLIVRGSGLDKGSLLSLAPLRGLRLAELDVSDNPLSDLTPLRGMPLEQLNLWHCPVSNLAPLKEMPLRWLKCGGHDRPFDLTPLAGMPLQSLAVSHSRVADLAPLNGLSLRQLDCRNTRVINFHPVRASQSLEELNGIPVADFWKGHDRRVAEYVLSVGGLVSINDEVTRRDAAMGLPPEEFRLWFSELFGNKAINDVNVGMFVDCEHLRSLDLTGTSVTGACVPVLKGCPKLEVLNLAYTDLGDAAIPTLKEFPSLTLINLDSTRISDACAVHFQGCKKLTELNIHNNAKIIDAALVPIAACANLTALNLDGTSITDRSVPQLMKLKLLEDLKISQTKITESGFLALKKAFPNCTVHWAATPP